MKWKLFSVLLILAFSSSSIFAQSWEEMDPVLDPPARIGHALEALADGTIFLYGGQSASSTILNDIWLFDGLNWNKLPDSVNNPAVKGHAIKTLADGTTLLYGGLLDTGQYHDSILIFDGTEFLPLAQIPDPKPPARAYFSSVPLADGTLWIGGGEGQSETMRDTWIFDLTANTWTQKAELGFPYKSATAVPYDGKVYILEQSNTHVFEYDPTTDIWNFLEYTGDTPPTRIAATVCQDDATVWTFGGENHIDGVFDTIIKTNLSVTPFEHRHLEELSLSRVFRFGVRFSFNKTEGPAFLLFGGMDESGNLYNDTVIFRPEGENQDDDDDQTDDDDNDDADGDDDEGGDDDDAGSDDDDDGGGCGC